MDLRGKTVLVTGAAGSGIGAGVCHAIRDAGGELVVNDLSDDATERTALHYQGMPVAGDISVPAAVEAIFAQIEASGLKLDGLVNNAGVGLSRPAHEAEVDAFDQVQNVDLRGVWLMTRAFTRHLLARGGAASIVNISSVHAHATMNRYAIYAGVKAGVEGLTRGLAAELGPYGIRCNAVAPGYVHSEQNLALMRDWTDDPEAWVAHHTRQQQALEREITPEDCGWAVVFFLSAASRCITGQVLRVDAGTTALLYNKSFV